MNICVISARGGSKGLPNKNIKIILGKPLIAWSIKQAKESKYIDKVYVCTDSDKIAKVAIKNGAEVPFLRPKYLAQSTTNKFQVFKFFLNKIEKHTKKKVKTYIDLDCTNPLRDIRDIEKSIELFNKNISNIDCVLSVTEARKNPYFNLLEKNKKGFLKISKKINGKFVNRRQEAPVVYEHVANIYVMKPSFIKKKNNLLEGNIIGYRVPQSKSLDIDSSFDYEIIEHLLRKKIKNEK